MRKIPTDWTPFQSLHGFVRLILLVDWDPIGIFGYVGAASQYDRYVEGVCNLLRAGASHDVLVAHLADIEKRRMEVRGDPRVRSDTAHKLLQVYRAFVQQAGWGDRSEEA